jgi:hypothetical protein
MESLKACLKGPWMAILPNLPDRMLACIAPDPDVVMYGTGADEKRTGLAGNQIQAERDWTQTDAAAFILHEPAISADGSVAWASADATCKVEVGGEELAFPARSACLKSALNSGWRCRRMSRCPRRTRNLVVPCPTAEQVEAQLLVKQPVPVKADPPSPAFCERLLY